MGDRRSTSTAGAKAFFITSLIIFLILLFSTIGIWAWFLDEAEDNQRIKDTTEGYVYSTYICCAANLITPIAFIVLVIAFAQLIGRLREVKAIKEDIRRREMERQRQLQHEAMLRKEEELKRQIAEQERLRRIEEKRQRSIIKARNLESAHGYEEAIKLYEKLEMWDDYARCKRKLRKLRLEEIEVGKAKIELKDIGRIGDDITTNINDSVVNRSHIEVTKKKKKSRK
jgi:hypothetical protein